MKPLCSVCAFRIWKISSCLRMPVAPATVMSLAIWVSFWMLMSFRSVMFNPGGRPACCGFCVSLGWDSVAVAVSAGAFVSGSLVVRAGAWRLWWVGMCVFC